MNICLLTAASHASVTNTSNALQTLGHAVTVVFDSNTATHDFTQYDLVIICRSNLSATVASAIQQRIVNVGIPLMLATLEAGMSLGTWTPTHAGKLGLCSDHLLDPQIAYHSIRIDNNEHPITAGLPLGMRQVMNGANYWSVLERPDRGGWHLGTMVATADPNRMADSPDLFAIEAGTIVNGDPLPRRIVVAGMIYGGQTAYTAEGVDLLGRMADWVVGVPDPGPGPEPEPPVSVAGERGWGAIPIGGHA